MTVIGVDALKKSHTLVAVAVAVAVDVVGAVADCRHVTTLLEPHC